MMGKMIYYNEITVMKAIEMLFITWFHFKFEWFYPTKFWFVNSIIINLHNLLVANGSCVFLYGRQNL